MSIRAYISFFFHATDSCCQVGMGSDHDMITCLLYSCTGVQNLNSARSSHGWTRFTRRPKKTRQRGCS